MHVTAVSTEGQREIMNWFPYLWLMFTIDILGNNFTVCLCLCLCFPFQKLACLKPVWLSDQALFLLRCFRNKWPKGQKLPELCIKVSQLGSQKKIITDLLFFFLHYHHLHRAKMPVKEAEWNMQVFVEPFSNYVKFCSSMRPAVVKTDSQFCLEYKHFQNHLNICKSLDYS